MCNLIQPMHSKIEYSEAQALKLMETLAELGYNVMLEQVNLITWQVIYWSELR